MPESEMVMAFDFGAKRIGVAIGETLLASARPLETIAADAHDQRFAAIGKLIAQWQPARLVVGRPAHADRDEPHAFAAQCEHFARQLADRFRLPVEFTDERYSSAIAEAGMTGDKRKNKSRLDAEAAAVILQAWLNQHHGIPASRH